jgi:hypothetical protein
MNFDSNYFNSKEPNYKLDLDKVIIAINSFTIIDYKTIAKE